MAFLVFYRLISLLKMPCCRFYPSCSTYALWLLQHEYLTKALLKIARRLLSCHPYSQGGIDYPTSSKPLQAKFGAPITPRYYFIPLHSHTPTPYYILKATSERK
ncbi:membrane protein insertion efficiency factor YidD [Helicobacter salomonis]|uniref:membrane protein insertion efficiency factor YidD n=1 Tax=Helicobacter salomonis TaxID=56878 RepID=UPI002278655D|nr:membrane protein insertion efficiency factor YidD [Helicobacter salomonis]